MNVSGFVDADTAILQPRYKNLQQQQKTVSISTFWHQFHMNKFCNKKDFLDTLYVIKEMGALFLKKKPLKSSEKNEKNI